MLGGGDTQNVALHTSAGKKVLKRYYWNWPHPQTEHAIYAHLLDRNFPVPQLQKNFDQLTYTDCGARCYAVFDFVDGFCVTNYLIPRTAQLRFIAQAGEMLAWLHAATIGFAPARSKLDGFRADGSGLVRDVAWHTERVRAFKAEALDAEPSEPANGFLRGLIDPLQEHLTKVGRHYQRPDPELPRQVIHADYTPHNLLVNQKNEITVLDFSAANVNLRALDVAYAAYAFAGLSVSFFDAEAAAVFVQSYLRWQNLTEREVLAFPDLVRWRFLRNIVWHMDYNLRQHERSTSHQALAQQVADRWHTNLRIQAEAERWQELFVACRNHAQQPWKGALRVRRPMH